MQPHFDDLRRGGRDGKRVHAQQATPRAYVALCCVNVALPEGCALPLIDPDVSATQVLHVLADGGIAVVPLDVAYAVLATHGEAIERIFAAKRRSTTKPNGMMGNWDVFTELHLVGRRERDIVAAVTKDFDLPLSVVAPFRADHPLIRATDPFALERSTKLGTLDLLLNAGPLHQALARQGLERCQPVLGSSANVSLTGSRFRLEDVEREIRAAADIEIDHGLVKYANDTGISSTIIDLTTFEVHRHGVCFDQIADVLRRWFSIDLAPPPAGP